MSRKETIKNLFAPQQQKLAAANPEPEFLDRPRQVAGPVRAMGLVLKTMAEQRDHAVVDIDPNLIDPSIVRDRFPDVDEARLAELRRSIEAHGQKLPILVREHPAERGRYQTAYGHRRVMVLRSLGQKVRAIVRPLTDEELILAQGVENAARLDLSYIERAMFAADLEAKGFERPVIMDALATDKTELSKMLGVARAVPRDLAERIGPAPATGRRRWLELAELLRDDRKLKAAQSLAAESDFPNSDSDTRFARVLAKSAGRQRTLPKKPTIWKTPDGRPLVRITHDAKTTTLTISQKDEPRFGAYVLEQLDELYRSFKAQARGED